MIMLWTMISVKHCKCVTTAAQSTVTCGECIAFLPSWELISQLITPVAVIIDDITTWSTCPTGFLILRGPLTCCICMLLYILACTLPVYSCLIPAFTSKSDFICLTCSFMFYTAVSSCFRKSNVCFVYYPAWFGRVAWCRTPEGTDPCQALKVQSYWCW